MHYIKNVTRAIAMLLLAILLALTGCDQGKIENLALPTATTQARKLLPSQQFHLEPWLEADIDWRQTEGTNLSILTAAHAGFRALPPLLPVFEVLTGSRAGT